MSLRTPIIALVIVPVLALAACGGSGGDDTDEFIADADAICTDHARQQADIHQEQGTPQSAEEEAQLIEALQPVQEDRAEQLQALDVPDDVAGDYEEYLSARQDLLANQQQDLDLVKQGKSPDDPERQQLYAEYLQLADDADAIGERIGFEACANKLPADEEEQVGSLVEEIETTPVDCTEVFTENFVETGFGGLDKCEQAQKGESPVKSLEIQKVGGVSGVGGFVDATPEGGPNDGVAGEWVLIYEDGTYKLDGTYALPSGE